MSTQEDNLHKEQMPASLFPFQLVDVRLYEIQAKRCDQEDELDGERAELPLVVRLADRDEPLDADKFRLQLRFETTLVRNNRNECTISITIEGSFRAIVDASTIKPEMTEKFRSTDAILLLWPYLRQTVHDLTNSMRLHVPPLPILDTRMLVPVHPGENEPDENE
ncbi:MAG: hypothetical protein JW850_16570 [Thermoflexales bacterium]|nr:hypothetical protein [Thermoflexales bacterium]